MVRKEGILLEKIKTNHDRILDRAKINYNAYNYDASDGLIDGVSVATKMASIERVYDTCDTRG